MNRHATLLAAILTSTASAQTASISFQGPATVEAGDTITIDVLCDFTPATQDDGIFGAAGLFLFTADRIAVTGSSTAGNTITIDPAFPHLQAAGSYGTANVLRVAGGVGSAPGAQGGQVKLFSFEQVVNTDAAVGDAIQLEYQGSVIIDAAGQLTTISSEVSGAAAFTSRTGTLTVGSSAPTPCNLADVAEPYQALDIDDVLTFLNGFATEDPVADVAPPSGTLDIDDVLLFLNAFSTGCP